MGKQCTLPQLRAGTFPRAKWPDVLQHYGAIMAERSSWRHEWLILSVKSNQGGPMTVCCLTNTRIHVLYYFHVTLTGNWAFMRIYYSPN